MSADKKNLMIGIKIFSIGFFMAILAFFIGKFISLRVGVFFGFFGWIIGFIGLIIYARHVIIERKRKTGSD